MPVAVTRADDGTGVTDDGTSVAVDDREPVFDSSVTDAAGGTGCGLAIVRAIAESHG